MKKLYYMGLEQYEARYSLQLQDWNERVFKRRGIDYHCVTGTELTTDKKIVTGSVLDAHGRTFYSLQQTSNLIKLMKEGKVTSEDVIFYEDMFTPGIESLPYILDQVPYEYRPLVFVRCLAQTIDPDDFVNREGMFRWMRKFEEMVDEFVDGILVASEEMVAHLRIAGMKAPIYVTGLPFGKDEVRSRIPNVKPITERKKRVGFAARWDDEKQPHFYMDLAEKFYKHSPDVEFAVFCGHPELKSNNPELSDRAYKLQGSGKANFKIYTGLKKNDYYELLADSTVLFNCALQDWVSNTVSEADTFGTLTLYPAYRSFPEVFANNPRNMYVPWSLNDAEERLLRMISVPETYDTGEISDWQDGTIDRTIDILEGDGDQWARNTNDYRKHISKAKY
jgi:glycosyltransferase involved in cell wall biosynthesis